MASAFGAGPCSSCCREAVGRGSSAPAPFSSSSLPPLFLLDLIGCDLPGGACSTFSCVLLAELWVGRIIRARKDPSGAFVLAMLKRAFDFWVVVDGAGKEGREEDLRTVDLTPRGGSRDEGTPRSFAGREGLLVFVVLARLGGREGAVSPSFAAEEAVVAVAAAGRRTGRVGDFGRGFAVGELRLGFLTGLPLGTLFSALAVVVPGAFAPAGARLIFETGSFLFSRPMLFEGLDGTCCLGDAVLDDVSLPMAFGERGALGDALELSVDAAATLAALGEDFFVLMAGGREELDVNFCCEAAFAVGPILMWLFDGSDFEVVVSFEVEAGPLRVLASAFCEASGFIFPSCSKGAPLRIAPRSWGSSSGFEASILDSSDCASGAGAGLVLSVSSASVSCALSMPLTNDTLESPTLGISTCSCPSAGFPVDNVSLFTEAFPGDWCILFPLSSGTLGAALSAVTLESLPPSGSQLRSLLSLCFFILLKGAFCPIRSTETKLVRTLERGRESTAVRFSEPTGDRPREGGDVES